MKNFCSQSSAVVTESGINFDRRMALYNYCRIIYGNKRSSELYFQAYLVYFLLDKQIKI